MTLATGTGNDFSVYSAITDYLQESFAANMIRYAPNGTAPLFGLTGMMKMERCVSVEHGYFSKTMVFPSVQIDNGGGAYTAGTTVLVVDSTTNTLAGDLLRSHITGEIMRVTSVDSATQVTVVRSVGDVAAHADAVANNAVIYNVGNAFEQGSAAPASRVMNPVRVVNYTQIFRNSWALPGTMEAVAPTVGNSLVAESRQDCGMFHSADIEKAFFFGQKSSGTIGGKYFTTMNGIIESVRTLAPAGNTTAAAGATTTYAQLETMLEGCFDTITDGRTGNDRLLFVGGTGRKVINGIGRLSGQYQIVDGQTAFGLQFQTFKTSRGTFRMIEHPMFNSNADWAKMIIAVDLPAVKPKYLRPTKNVEFGMDGRAVQDGADAVGGTLTTELTLEIINPSAFAVAYGLTAAAA